MKWVVLMSNGILAHNFYTFNTKEEAEAYAAKRKDKNRAVYVRELTEEVWF